MTDTTGHAELIGRLRRQAASGNILPEHPIMLDAADALAASDEIERELSEECERLRITKSALAQARKDAFEEAAIECQAQMLKSDYPRTAGDCAAAIRALITKGETG